MATEPMRAAGWALSLALLALAPACDGREPARNDPAVTLALAGRITDQAGIVSPEAERRMSDRLAAFERRTGHQLVAVSIRSLNGRDIADVARDLGNRWGVGRAGIDDGVLLLVAPVERQVRIAVGRGLEDRLTDERCRKIIDKRMLPYFRRGDMESGVEAGVRAIIDELQSRSGD